MIGPASLKFAGLLLSVSFVAGCTIEVEADGDADVQGSVQGMLEESAGEWNRGELAGFMDDYVDSATTT